MNSLNHYSLGAVGEYLFGMVGGIQPDAAGLQDPYSACGSRRSLVGQDQLCLHPWHNRDGLDWNRGKLTLIVTIPANTTATVYVPAQDVAGVTESGKLAAKAEGVKFLRMEHGRRFSRLARESIGSSLRSPKPAIDIPLDNPHARPHDYLNGSKVRLPGADRSAVRDHDRRNAWGTVFNKTPDVASDPSAC